VPQNVSIDDVLKSVGFSGSGLQTAKAVILAESGGNVRSYNGKGKDRSYGLFQVNMYGSMGPDRMAKYGLKSYDDLYDPYINAKVAFDLSNGGRNWKPWTTYVGGKYKAYLGRNYDISTAGGASTATGGAPAVGSAGTTLPAEKKLDTATLASKYGYSMAFFKSDKALWALIQESTREQYTPDEFGARLRNTKWFKTHSESVRKWYVLERADAATAQARLHQTKVRLIQLGQRQGINVDPKRLADMAWRVNAYEWDDSQVATAMAAEMKFDPKVADYYGGLAEKRGEIKEQAAAYGIAVTDETVFNLSKQLVGETTTPEAVTEYIKKVAKTKYQGLADDIDKGMTVADYAEPYVETQARLLELNPADVQLNDPAIQRALSFRDPKTGVIAPMSMTDHETAIKKDPRWMKTKNARDEMLNGSRQILADWGLQ